MTFLIVESLLTYSPSCPDAANLRGSAETKDYGTGIGEVVFSSLLRQFLPTKQICLSITDIAHISQYGAERDKPSSRI